MSCVGDTRQYSYILASRKYVADIALKSALIGKQNVKYYSFFEKEVMKDSIAQGVDLPVCGFSRTMENIKNIIQVQIT